MSVVSRQSRSIGVYFGCILFECNFLPKYTQCIISVGCVGGEWLGGVFECGGRSVGVWLECGGSCVEVWLGGVESQSGRQTEVQREGGRERGCGCGWVVWVSGERKSHVDASGTGCNKLSTTCFAVVVQYKLP